MTEDHKLSDMNGSAEPTTHEIPLSDQVVNTKVIWDDRKMVTTFANVVNVLATREEVTLLFGVNQTWNTPYAKDLTVELSNRMILTPPRCQAPPDPSANQDGRIRGPPRTADAVTASTAPGSHTSSDAAAVTRSTRCCGAR